VTSVSEAGAVNLAPYSFFNGFGANPAVVVFSPTYRGVDGTPKDTLRNVVATKEFAISVVTWPMVEQMNLASAEYPGEVDEFERSGFTKLPGVKVRPPGVAESPLVMEGTLLQHVELGARSASGNLLIGEILTFRVAERVLDAEGKVDPAKLDQVGRLGGNWYTRAKEGLFELAKPTGLPVGMGALPPGVRSSELLTGAELAKMASVTKRPDGSRLVEDLRGTYGGATEREVHEQIRVYVRLGDLERAWALAELFG
jgi:flavin reductase (DIM6/NTAB) family NADH-FMN oxidoreductase RutF